MRGRSLNRWRKPALLSNSKLLGTVILIGDMLGQYVSLGETSDEKALYLFKYYMKTQSVDFRTTDIVKLFIV